MKAMNMRSILYVFAGLIAGGLLFFLIQWLFLPTGDSTRYVSMTLVFEECNIRDKYEKELKQLEENSNARLAAFENEIRGLKSSGGDAAKISAMEKELFTMRDALTEEYQNKSATFERVIWEKINQKINEYGKEKGYDYIFGAKGDGSIMYASDAKDITKEVIAYINK